ncbi:2-amino-4-hydroxy-6-hydroxymethyldihydropteridine diphosphokinase [Aquibacillus sp. 3ASR75-11]|uniref:2-amino-4-hydroxy-6-hydroxymethyldihydropteridine diphosphokinase n=1 Tax=Terrihalobacillus insolitus TaxID=2950438 RepID=A0A9X3WXB4_9BACI|nr:2-amino-4-hydroxy-6-hydroxymethyldihydropteridine diphosphokinase [Terrihalobacillus insolitus]MDC3414844.1 2-amino-4-hydroxy-6-hydroxymethyldihydropteridine diphosphokinase [Terrihalobacillus insolitus]MDC3426243.1 2-amino-4-hydroxy-6-hydroxymethyldihydropteridine diphosphokinase [Terrihalobacillus insolitus]
MNIGYIALGSNISPRSLYLKKALQALRDKEELIISSVSSVYETKPVGYTSQKNFLNMVVKVETTYTAYELLKYCLKIEKNLDRKREIRWGPRTIDLDILVFNKENIESEQLTIPHPRMHERAFVLIPLNDLNPNMMIPTINKSVSDILMTMSAEEKEGVTKWNRSIGENGFVHIES